MAEQSALTNYSERLYNEDLAPVKERTWSGYSLFAMWMADVHSIGGYTFAAGLFFLGPAREPLRVPQLLGGFIGAIGGIMVCDYYVFRRRRLNVPDLYRLDGQFRYWHGIYPAGVIAWVAAALVSLIWLDIAFLLGFPIAFVLYYVLMRFWVLPRYKQAEIESGYDDRFLATSLGLNWVYHRGEGFTRERTEEIPETAVAREDL